MTTPTEERCERLLPVTRGEGKNTYKAYSVEARYNYHSPKEFCGHMLDKTWRGVSFAPGVAGVPDGTSYFSPLNHMFGLLSFQAAQALRWWFMADADRGRPGDLTSCNNALCLETRIIEHTIEYTYKHSATRVLDVVDDLRKLTTWVKPKEECGDKDKGQR